MGIASDAGEGPRFVPASAEDLRGFTADASPLAHYMTYGPGGPGAVANDPAEQLGRREALARLIEGTF
ncbi:hypothetical protein FNJ84_18190 [Paracoccus sp. M683]|uniref:hypothetical protein n=1 Tax=Paracoccus sp. M683 TaxID=2594268 RepID=UPI001181584A|nr:hypothetical protein [Paracoccus sp. M683]TRW94798.1 hypothetical protein FNJ84_18190 [Paracoccus sp. M683]